MITPKEKTKGINDNRRLWRIHMLTTGIEPVTLALLAPRSRPTELSELDFRKLIYYRDPKMSKLGKNDMHQK